MDTLTKYLSQTQLDEAEKAGRSGSAGKSAGKSGSARGTGRQTAKARGVSEDAFNATYQQEEEGEDMEAVNKNWVSQKAQYAWYCLSSCL